MKIISNSSVGDAAEEIIRQHVKELLRKAGLYVPGFILSIGMAVDANVLIFERIKEELKKGKSIYDSLHEGFSRAWLSIRDSNISSIITAVILFWLGTSAVKGFASGSICQSWRMEDGSVTGACLRRL